MKIPEHQKKIFLSFIFFDYVVVLNRAVDGNLNAIYRDGSCTHTSNEKTSPWLVIDLLGSYEITHVKIKNRKDCCSKFTKLNKISQKCFLVLSNRSILNQILNMF